MAAGVIVRAGQAGAIVSHLRKKMHRVHFSLLTTAQPPPKDRACPGRTIRKAAEKPMRQRVAE